MRKITHALIVFFCLLLLATSDSSSQTATAEEATAGTAQLGQPAEKDSHIREWERQQVKAKNQQRHDNLKKDTDKLLQLAADLKIQVDKSNEQTLSLDVVKKAEEIEKLARNIQKKMKGD